MQRSEEAQARWDAEVAHARRVLSFSAFADNDEITDEQARAYIYEQVRWKNQVIYYDAAPEAEVESGSKDWEKIIRSMKFVPPEVPRIALSDRIPLTYKGIPLIVEPTLSTRIPDQETGK